jgi:hypothetical protein
VAIFCQTKQIFVGRSLATVKKICEVWRKMGLFGPDSVPPNQLRAKHHYFGDTNFQNCATDQLITYPGQNVKKDGTR